jgi:hypothetical protein
MSVKEEEEEEEFVCTSIIVGNVKTYPSLHT